MATSISNAKTIGQALEDAVWLAADRIGYVFQSRQISFAEMDEWSDRVATGLLRLGVQKGDRIGIIGLNQPEWITLYFAAAKIGAVVLSPWDSDFETTVRSIGKPIGDFQVKVVKEMYLQGGFNVYPVEVENLLTQHPKVMMAAGIGVPDPVLGEVGRYYIVPRPGWRTELP